MLLKWRVLLNAGSNWANMFVAAVTGLIVVPVILARVGSTGYGIWALLAYGLAYPHLLEAAFALSINRFVAFYREDPKQLNAFVSASFVIMVALSIVTIAAAVAISFFLSDLFRAITPEFERSAQITCILVGVTLALQMLQSTHSGALRGYEYYTRSNAILMVASILRTAMIIIFLMFWKSIIVIQTAYVISMVLAAMATFIVAHYSIDGLKINLKLINKSILWELWLYTYHSIARSGSTIVMFNTLTLLVGWKGTAQDVTVYDIAFKFPNLIRSLLGGMQNVFLPVVTSLTANKQVEAIKSIVKRMTQMCFILTFIVVIPLIIFAEPLLRFWLRGGVSENLVVVMNILMISSLPDGLFGLWLPVLVGVGHFQWLTKMSIGGAIAAIVTAFVLIHGFVSVPMAPSIALLITMWIYRGIWLPLYGIKKLEIGFGEYFMDSISHPLIAGFVSIVVLWLLNSISVIHSIHWMIRGGIFTLIVVICFAAISLRREVAYSVVLIKKGIWGRKRN
jgi:O-antigen/teichoic acid export membrane protein